MAAGRVVTVFLAANTTAFTSSMAAASASAKGLSTSLNGQNAGFSTLSKVAAGFGVAAAVGIGKAVSAFSDFDSAMSGVAAATMATGAELDALGEAALNAGRTTVFTAEEAAGAITNLAKAGVSTADIMGGALAGALDLAAAGELDVGLAAEIAATAMTQFNLSGADVPRIADLLAAAAGKAQGEVTDMAAAMNQSGLVASQMGLSIEETVGTLAAFASAGLIGSDAGTSFRTMLLRLANPSQEAAALMEKLGISAYDAQGNFVGMESLAGQLQTRLSGLSQEQRNAALATIFGSDAIRAANVLYNEGAEGIAGWTDEVNDAGYASEQAAKKTDNLKGDLERLGGAFDSLLITIGSGFDAALRAVVQAVTALVDGFNNLDGSGVADFFESVGETAGNVWQIMVNLWDALGPVIVGFGQLAAGAIVGALNLIAGALAAITGFLAENETLVTALAVAVGFGLVASFVKAQASAVQAMAAMAGMSTLSMVGAITGVTSFSTALGAAATAAGKLVTAMLPLAAVAAVTMLVIEIASMGDTADEAREQIDAMWDAIKKAGTSTERIAAVAAAIDQTKTSIAGLNTELADMKAATDFGNAIEVALGGISDTEEAIALYREELARLEAEQQRVIDNTKGLSNEFGISGDKVLELADKYGIDLTGSLEGLTPKFEKLLRAEQATTAGQEAAKVAADALASGYLDTAEAADALMTIMEEMTGQFQSSLEAQTSYQAGLAEMAALFAEIGTAGADAAGNLDLTTEAGRQLSSQLIANSDDINSVIDALVREGDTEGALAAATQLRERFVADAIAMGLSTTEATRLADGLLGIPSEVATAIAQTGAAEAEDGANRVKSALGNLPDVTYSDVSVTGAEEGQGKVRAVGEALLGLPDATLPAVNVTGTEDSNAKIRATVGELGAIPRQTYPNVSITGTEDGNAKIRGVVGALGAMPRQTYPNVSVTGTEDGNAKIRGVVGALGAMPRQTYPNVSVTGTEDGNAKIRGVVGALAGIPRGTYPNVTVNADYNGAVRAKQAIDAVQSKSVNVNVNYSSSGSTAQPRAIADGGYFTGFAAGGAVQAFPRGGPVWGAGSARSDSINARLSNGEFVMNAADTARNRGELEAGNRGAKLMVVPGYAGGTPVPARATPGKGWAGIDYDRLAAAVAKHPILMDGRVVTAVTNQVNRRNAVR